VVLFCPKTPEIWAFEVLYVKYCADYVWLFLDTLSRIWLLGVVLTGNRLTIGEGVHFLRHIVEQ
jgi:hypothetical protein